MEEVAVLEITDARLIN